MRTKKEIIKTLESVNFELEFEYLARHLDKEELNFLCDWIEKYHMNITSFGEYCMEVELDMPKYRYQLKKNDPNYVDFKNNHDSASFVDFDASEETKEFCNMVLEYERFSSKFGIIIN